MRFSGTLIATSRSSARASLNTDCPAVTTWPESALTAVITPSSLALSVA